jgi:acyl-CoA synthetase (AMP-forming)/AMP-acid ligase II
MEFNLADLFEGVADAVPDRGALVCGDRRLTFVQLEERANRLAHYLHAKGIGKGDHVGLYLHNSTEYVEGMLAAFKVRAVPININYRYVDDELRYLFDNADLAALIHHRRFGPRVAGVAGGLPLLRIFLAVDDGSAGECSATGSVDYEEALARSSGERDFPTRSGDDLYILYTGGTTGMPKGVMWRHEDIFFAALMGGNPFGSPPERPAQAGENASAHGVMTVLPAAPLMHASGQWATLIALYAGGRIALVPGGHFEPARIWQLVQDERVNSLAIVGDAMARPLAEALSASSYDTSSLLVIGSGGATFSQTAKDELRQRLPNVVLIDGFGGSEVGRQGHAIPSPNNGKRQGPRFQMDETTAVLGEDLRPLPPGSSTVGMLARRGRIPLGYYKDPQKTAAAFVEVDGVRWALTGDVAALEPDDTIVLLGRGATCINSGGEKIFPEEVEAALRSHPSVLDAVVVGLPDWRWGERVVAVVQARPGRALTLEDLAAHCRVQVAAYKVPRALHLVNAVQHQPSGKPDYEWARAVAASNRAATGDAPEHGAGLPGFETEEAGFSARLEP